MRNPTTPPKQPLVIRFISERTSQLKPLAHHTPTLRLYIVGAGLPRPALWQSAWRWSNYVADTMHIFNYILVGLMGILVQFSHLAGPVQIWSCRMVPTCRITGFLLELVAWGYFICDPNKKIKKLRLPPCAYPWIGKCFCGHTLGVWCTWHSINVVATFFMHVPYLI